MNDTPSLVGRTVYAIVNTPDGVRLETATVASGGPLRVNLDKPMPSDAAGTNLVRRLDITRIHLTQEDAIAAFRAWAVGALEVNTRETALLHRMVDAVDAIATAPTP